MNLCIGSAFRNSAARVPAYLDQVDALGVALKAAGHWLSGVFVWGDCTDDTRDVILAELERRGMRKWGPALLKEHSHGGPVFGSTEAPERMAALSGVGNAILEGVGSLKVPGDTHIDALFYVESDLLWDPQTVLALLAELKPGVEVVAPLIMAGQYFYDIWGFRDLDGARFAPTFPYHPDLFVDQMALMEVSSAGSALMMTADIARKTRMSTGALVEWCANARAAGARIWVDPTLTIRHPA